MPAPIDLTNQRYGRLTAVRLARRKGRSRFWRCVCECGKAVTVSVMHLRSGHTKSCGCLKTSRLPRGESAFHALVTQYRRNARTRDLSFSLTKEEFRELVRKPCAYCGTPPSTVMRSKYGTGDFYYNGLDRVNNRKGYTSENAAPCCKLCNFMKKKLGYEVFVKHVLAIASHLSKSVLDTKPLRS